MKSIDNIYFWKKFMIPHPLNQREWILQKFMIYLKQIFFVSSTAILNKLVTHINAGFMWCDVVLIWQINEKRYETNICPWKSSPKTKLYKEQRESFWIAEFNLKYKEMNQKSWTLLANCHLKKFYDKKHNNILTMSLTTCVQFWYLL